MAPQPQGLLNREFYCVTAFKLLAKIGSITLVFSACSQAITVSVNDQAVYDPSGRIVGSTAIDADLQGCINLAMRQQNLQSPAELTVLSCSSSAIRNLTNVGQLAQLRFLDMSNNNITNITPLEDLRVLGGLSLSNNQISDIAPLFNMPGLTSVSLLGNNDIPCQQLQRLRNRLGTNLTAPTSCRN